MQQNCVLVKGYQAIASQVDNGDRNLKMQDRVIVEQYVTVCNKGDATDEVIDLRKRLCKDFSICSQQYPHCDR